MIPAGGASAMLPLLVSVPLLGGLASFVLGDRGRWAALGALALNAVLAALLLAATRAGPLDYALGGWSAPLGIALGADGLSALFVAVSALVTLVAGVYSLAYFAGGSATGRVFWPLWCLLLAALNTLFVTRDLFNTYVAIEVLGLSAVALVTLAGDVTAVRAALRYLLVSLVGSLCYLMGVALVYRVHGVLDAGALARISGSSPLECTALALMSAGLLLKTALFPLHFWLPEAHASAPAPVSAALSALVLKGTFYVLLRLWFEILPGAAGPGAGTTLAVLGAAAIAWGSLMAARTPRLKRLVAYSTVAQIGYLFLLFPLLGRGPGRAAALDAVVYFVLAHACAKAAMFLAAGNVQSVAGHDRIDELRGDALPGAGTQFAFALAGISLVGLPPTGGFAAKWMLLQGAAQAGAWWLFAVALGGALLAAIYVFRVLARCFDLTSVLAGREAPRLVHVPACREWSALVLALAALVLGLVAGPLLSGIHVPGVPR